MHSYFTMTFPSFHFTARTHPSHPRHRSLHFIFGWFYPHLLFALFITFLPLFLKLLHLQERVPKAFAGNWFQSWVILGSFSFSCISRSLLNIVFTSVHVICLNHCSLLISSPLSISKLWSPVSLVNMLLLKNSYLSLLLFIYSFSTFDIMDLWRTAASNFRVLTYVGGIFNSGNYLFTTDTR
jgi:hypothetical protein